MTHRLPTLTQAAKQLGVSRNALFEELRRLKIIDQKNYAGHKYRTNGLLVVQRGFVNRDTGRSGNYWVTVATDNGLLFLKGIADAMGKNGAVVVAEQHGPSNQRSEGEHGTDLRRMESPHESVGYAAGTPRRDRQPGSSSTTLRG